MLTVAGHAWAQGLNITTGRLRALWRSRDPDQAPSWLEHGIGTDLDIAANRVEHHVAVGNGLGKILDVVIDHSVGTQTAYVVVVTRAGRGDNRGANMLAELDPEASHATRTTLDQNGFAGLELRRILEGPQGGETGQRHGGCLGMPKALRLLGDDRGLDSDLLRVRAFDALIAHPEHRVTDSEVGDTRPDRTDHAGEVAAQDMWEAKIRAPASQAHFVIGRVDAGRMNVDYHLARPGGRVRRVSIAQH